MSDTLKYIVVEVRGIETPIMFPNWIEHHEIAKAFGGRERVLSAGCVRISGNPFPLGECSTVYPTHHGVVVKVYGGSQTLGKEAIEGDALLIKKVLERDLTLP